MERPGAPLESNSTVHAMKPGAIRLTKKVECKQTSQGLDTSSGNISVSRSASFAWKLWKWGLREQARGVGAVRMPRL